MQYWKKDGKIERLEEEIFEQHPEKLQNLKNAGFERIKSENDFSLYKKAPAKKISVKKAIKKVAKKFLRSC